MKWQKGSALMVKAQGRKDKKGTLKPLQTRVRGIVINLGESAYHEATHDKSEEQPKQN